jgi:hypothetical protein
LFFRAFSENKQSRRLNPARFVMDWFVTVAVDTADFLAHIASRPIRGEQSMIKYVPLYGSILLTIIIVWIVVSTIIGNRRKIGQAVAGSYIRSTCCGATTTPIGWTEEGWTSRCDACGQWQYLGDDHDNPPPGFNHDGTPISRVYPAPRPSTARGPDAERQHGVRPTFSSEVTSGEDAPLAVPPPPNIGGEGHPDYQGPHYLVPHERFVPYDVLRDPPEGAAVHIVGSVACVGPLEVETGDRGRAALDSSREDEDRE